MVRRQGGEPGRAAVLPHGRFLRAVLRRCRSRVRGARHRACPSRRPPGPAGADVRRARPCRRGLPGAADPSRLPRGGLRADGDAGAGQAAQGKCRPPRGGAPGHPGHADRGQPAGSRPPGLAAGAGAGRERHAGRRLAGHFHRRLRDRGAAARRVGRPAGPAGAGRGAGAERPGAGQRGGRHPPRRHAETDGSVRRAYAGRLRQLHRRRDHRRRHGAGLRQGHPARRPAAALPPGAAWRPWPVADGRRHPPQPGNPAPGKRRLEGLPAGRRGPHHHRRRRAGTRGTSGFPAGRTSRNRRPARRRPRPAAWHPAARHAAGHAEGRAGHGPRPGPALAGPLRPARPGGGAGRTGPWRAHGRRTGGGGADAAPPTHRRRRGPAAAGRPQPRTGPGPGGKPAGPAGRPRPGRPRL